MNKNDIENLKWKKPIRIIAYPFEQVRRRLRVWKYSGSEDSQYIRSLKDIHKGKRCFIIGNGPSLLAKDLSLLSDMGEISFAANRIYRIYPQTSWRPTYYLSLDNDILFANYEDIRLSGRYPKFIDYAARFLQRKPEDNIHYLCNYSSFKVNMEKRIPKELSSDVSKYCTQNGTVTVNAIELAIYMGIKAIYLLGVDNNYRHKRQANGEVYVDPTVSNTYFAGGEPDKREGVSIQIVGLLDKSYEVAKHFAEKYGVKIYNATRGGKLEVFERVDFDEIMTRGGGKM